MGFQYSSADATTLASEFPTLWTLVTIARDPNACRPIYATIIGGTQWFDTSSRGCVESVT